MHPEHAFRSQRHVQPIVPPVVLPKRRGVAKRFEDWNWRVPDDEWPARISPAMRPLPAAVQAELDRDAHPQTLPHDHPRYLAYCANVKAGSARRTDRRHPSRPRFLSRPCVRCQAIYLPTSHRQERCAPCGEIVRHETNAQRHREARAKERVIRAAGDIPTPHTRNRSARSPGSPAGGSPPDGVAPSRGDEVRA